MHPPSASRVLLPDGRYMAYPDQGIPGVKTSLLDEYGVAWSHMIFLGLGRVILIPTGISTRAAMLAPMINPYEPHMTKRRFYVFVSTDFCFCIGNSEVD
ncbi:hypothetical protein glysoja_016575 [Glycine soja]|nr:hypothetical protein glysoja_016575 [Glycine soja]